MGRRKKKSTTKSLMDGLLKFAQSMTDLKYDQMKLIEDKQKRLEEGGVPPEKRSI